jgi:hypothetical protein
MAAVVQLIITHDTTVNQNSPAVVEEALVTIMTKTFKRLQHANRYRLQQERGRVGDWYFDCKEPLVHVTVTTAVN